MELSEHEKSCVKTFGKPYTEIHRFLDEPAQKYGKGGVARSLLHHKKGIQLVRERFGEEAAKAAEQHVKEDFGFIAESWEDLEPYTFFLSDWEMMEWQKDLETFYGNSQPQQEQE